MAPNRIQLHAVRRHTADAFGGQSMPRAKKAEPKGKKKRKPGSGRKGDITAHKVSVLVRAIGLGLPKCRAAAVAKMSSRCLLTWLKRGEEQWEAAGEDETKVPREHKLYVRLVLGMRAAQAKTMEDALRKIGAADQWQAQAWLLSRLSPGRFSDQRRELQETKRILGDVLDQLRAYQKDRPAEPLPDEGGKSGEAIPIPGVEVPKVETPSPELPPLTEGAKGD